MKNGGRMKKEPDKRLQNVKINYGRINIENKKFIAPILELLQELNTHLSEKKAG